MGSTSDKISGAANKAAGTVKEKVGEAVGSDKMRKDGAAQQIKGEAQEALGKGKDAVKGAIDKVGER